MRVFAGASTRFKCVLSGEPFSLLRPAPSNPPLTLLEYS